MAGYFERSTQNGPVTSLYCSEPPAGDTHSILLVSDVHFDSVYCNRDLFQAHLEKAKERNAEILIMGDFFDAMQGRFDPRRSMNELRPEYRRNDYYDFVVEDAANFLEPYAGNICVLAKGNHESSVLKNANVDLTNRLAFLMNIRHESNILVGGYGGWVRFMFHFSKNERGSTHSIRMKYFHGSGGEAPVTRGAIQTNRQAVYLPDANIVVNGHSHHTYYMPISRERVSAQGVVYFDIQHHVRIPGYKMDYADGTGGWTVEKGMVPKPIGSFWLNFKPNYLHARSNMMTVKPEPEIESPETMAPVLSGDGDFDPYLQDSEYP